MNNNQSPKHGSAKLSSLNPKSSSKKNENILKYFAENKHNEDGTKNQNVDQFDSPYKKFLSNKIKCEITESDDLSKDFRTPKPIKVHKKTQNKTTVSVNRKSKPKSKSNSAKSKSTISSIFKATQDNFGLSDVNPDHLQMALALSKSTYAVEYPEHSKNVEDFPTFLSPEKIPKGKTTLERYGFKSNRPKLCTDLKREPFEIPKKNKNSKFRFITPTLKTRTVEDRESMISAKISMILCSNKSFYIEDSQEVKYSELCSEMLREFKGNYSLFAANGFGLEENGKYYNKNLNISPTNSKCGCLLKKWEDIPGRDKSPIRKESKFEVVKTYSDSYTSSENTRSPDSQKTNKECKVTTDISVSKSSESLSNPSDKYSTPRECISPNLFDSESETEYVPISPGTTEDFSQSLLSPSIKKLRPLSSESDNSANENMPTCSNPAKEIVNLKQNKAVKNFQQHSEDEEDTEELYLKSLQSEDEFVMNLTQNSSSSKRYESVIKRLWPQNEDGTDSCLDNKKIEDECIILSSSSDFSNDCPTDKFSKKLNLDENLPTVFEKGSFNSDRVINHNSEEEEDTEQLYLKSLQSEDEFVTDLTQNSSSNTCNEYATKKLWPENFKQSEDECIILSSSSDCSNDCPADKISTKSDLNEKLRTIFEASYIYDSSSLQLSNSRNSLENNFENENETSSTPKASLRMSFGLGGVDDCNKTLNVTDYIHQMLNVNGSKIDEDKLDNSTSNANNNSSIDLNNCVEIFDTKNCVQDENAFVLSQESCSQESIVISDEELNYSSVHSKDTRCNKYFYDSSDTEEILENDENEVEDVDMDEVYRISSALRNKYLLKTALTPVHNRITELRGGSSPKIKSPTEPCLEDSFNNVLENSNVLKTLEHEFDEKSVPNSPSENKCTPEKSLITLTSDTEKTPDNNLIIKTKDVTPLPNYDEMNTPEIVNELHKFGLKPLKRQRGVKLLKYLYENTHPLVGPDELEKVSSDEDEQKRVPKKRKKSKETDSPDINPIVIKNGGFMGDQDDIEIVGDALLQNQNLDELIFERKHSVKISSCRVPLQIVWHNFLSKNPQIKESILLYEPLQLEVLHVMLKEQTGCKFHIQDLLTFFDRKCITIRTAQGSQRGGRKTKF